MPTPKKGERKKKFIKRCIPDLFKEEGTLTSKDKKSKQSYAICNSMFDRRKKKKNENILYFDTFLNENIEKSDFEFNDEDFDFEESDNKEKLSKIAIDFGNWLSRNYGVSNGIGWWVDFEKEQSEYRTEDLWKIFIKQYKMN